MTQPKWKIRALVAHTCLDAESVSPIFCFIQELVIIWKVNSFYIPEKTDLLFVCTGPDPVKAVNRCVEDPRSEQTRCRQQANTTHPGQWGPHCGRDRQGDTTYPRSSHTQGTAFSLSTFHVVCTIKVHFLWCNNRWSDNLDNLA